MQNNEVAGMLGGGGGGAGMAAKRDRAAGRLPDVVQILVYSYLSFSELINFACKLSKKDRAMLAQPQLQEEFLRYPRNLLLNVNDN